MTDSAEPEKTDEKKQGFVGETVKTVLIALVVAFVLRTLLFQPFHIPSGSMEPTLYKGDYLITSKYSLGYGTHSAEPFKLPIKKGRWLERIPKRGDIIVFKPVGSKVHFIKRLVGLPGDRIQMKAGKLYINDILQPSELVSEDTQAADNGAMLRHLKYKETLSGAKKSHMTVDKIIGSGADDTGVYSVPAGHYFFLGDNRDNSLDSRFASSEGGVGSVPAANLVGRAEFILLSVDDDFVLFKPWTWGNMRGDRFFKGLR